MSTRYVDALKGYEFFIHHHGRASRHDINFYLFSQGRRAINQRIYRHYKGLIRLGIEGYIPINKFKLFESLGRIQVVGDRRRWRRQAVELSGRYSIDEMEWQDVLITDISETGFGILSSERITIKAGTLLWIRLEGYNHLPATLVWRKYPENETRFGVRTLEFVTKYKQIEEKMDIDRITGELRILRLQKGELHWSDFNRVLEKINELLHAVSALIHAVDQAVEVEIGSVQPVLSSIRFGSRRMFRIKVDFWQAAILKAVRDMLVPWHKMKERYRKGIKQPKTAGNSLDIEIARNALFLKNVDLGPRLSGDLVESLRNPLCDALGIEKLPEELFGPESLETGILLRRILPAAAELIAGDDPDFNLEVVLND